jgi:hypothetical protein
LNLPHFIHEKGCTASEPLASFLGENVLFDNELNQIKQFDHFRELATYLIRRKETYHHHAKGFWGSRTKSPIHWKILEGCGDAAQALLVNDGVEKNWHELSHAIEWYVRDGWKVDETGEYLMQELPIQAGTLIRVQNTLRKAYLQVMDRTNTVFSEFSTRSPAWTEHTTLPYVGEALKIRLDEKKDPAAVIMADAFRFELGKRLAALINDGQTFPVALVTPCKAPVPTTTELGMAYALPGAAQTLRVDMDAEKGWIVHAAGGKENLATADSRRNWLFKTYGVSPSHLLSVTDAVKTGFKIPEGKRIFFFDSKIDSQGHEGELAISGAEALLERYAQLIRKLRDAGYGRIYLTTDHGYFHYIPGDDEVIENPDGDIRWKTRRAIVGKHLKHKTAVLTKIAGSDLECLTPRSVNAFKAYGGMGFFHRGATLQEWLIPLVCIQWQKKARKTGIILKPISEITTLEPVIEVEPETRGKKNLFGEIDGSYLGRQIVIKVRDAASGKVLFKSAAVPVSPKDDIRQVKLEKISGAEGRYGQKLILSIIDDDNEEVLATADITLKMDMDEWL